MKIIDYLKPFDVNGFQRMRLGINDDGGYVIPKQMISTIDCCITFGVGNDISFELNLYNNNPRCKFILYDPTISILPSVLQNSVFYNDKWISSYESDNKITPHNVLNNAKIYEHILLKCDIEGGEYGSIQTLFENDIKKIDLLLIEIHDIYDNEKNCKDLLDFISKWFTCFHVHANVAVGLYKFTNDYIPHIYMPKMYEITYINNNIIKNKFPYDGPLPIPGIDYSNTPYINDIDLSFLCTGCNI